MRETFSNLTEPKTSDLPTQRLKYQQEATDTSEFVNVKTKIYYDSSYIPSLLNVGNQMYCIYNYITCTNYRAVLIKKSPSNAAAHSE